MTIKKLSPPSPPPPPERLTIKKITGEGVVRAWERVLKAPGWIPEPRMGLPLGPPLGTPKIHKMMTQFFALGLFIKSIIKGCFFVVLKGGVLFLALHPPIPKKVDD